MPIPQQKPFDIDPAVLFDINNSGTDEESIDSSSCLYYQFPYGTDFRMQHHPSNKMLLVDAMNLRAQVVDAKHKASSMQIPTRNHRVHTAAGQRQVGASGSVSGCTCNGSSSAKSGDTDNGNDTTTAILASKIRQQQSAYRSRRASSAFSDNAVQVLHSIPPPITSFNSPTSLTAPWLLGDDTGDISSSVSRRSTESSSRRLQPYDYCTTDADASTDSSSSDFSSPSPSDFHFSAIHLFDRLDMGSEKKDGMQVNRSQEKVNASERATSSVFAPPRSTSIPIATKREHESERRSSKGAGEERHAVWLSSSKCHDDAERQNSHSHVATADAKQQQGDNLWEILGF